MHRIRYAAIALGLSAASPAQAEFSLSYGHPTHMDVPHLPDAATADLDASPDDPADQPHALMFRTSAGFGRNIPLGFAVRQIVPAGIRISYGRGVRPDSIVSWKGGRPWPSVLLAAVIPLGLNVRATGRSVSIVIK